MQHHGQTTYQNIFNLIVIKGVDKICKILIKYIQDACFPFLKMVLSIRGQGLSTYPYAIRINSHHASALSDSDILL